MAKGKGGSGGGKSDVVGLVVATLLALAGGAGFGFYLDGQLKTDAALKPKSKDKEAEKSAPDPTVSAGMKLIPLAPIVANLAAPQDTWIRIESSVLLQGVDQGADALAASLSEDIVAYLKTATLAQFEGPSGFQNLREDILDRAAIRDGEHIKDVVIHGVVIE
jgi:flagellar FliL protein